MTAHATFAPSSAARWLACPASAMLAAEQPRRESEAASRGTYIHALLESAIETRSTAHIPESVNQGDEDVVGNIELILEYIGKLGPGDIYAEREVVLSDLVWGTADLVHLSPCQTIATIGDYKNGAFDIEAIDNKQMLTYAAALLREFPSIVFFRLAIFQPNSRTAGEVEPVKQWVAPRETVLAHAVKIDDAVARARAGGAPIPGRHCRWCPAFGSCPATKTTIGLVLQAVEMLPSQIPDEAIVRVARVLRGLEDFRKLVDKEILDRLQTGREIEGATLEPGRTFRQWRDEFLAKQELYAAFKMEGLAPLSPAQAEKLGSQGRAIAAKLAHKPQGQLKAQY